MRITLLAVVVSPVGGISHGNRSVGTQAVMDGSCGSLSAVGSKARGSGVHDCLSAVGASWQTSRVSLVHEARLAHGLRG